MPPIKRAERVFSAAKRLNFLRKLGDKHPRYKFAKEEAPFINKALDVKTKEGKFAFGEAHVGLEGTSVTKPDTLNVYAKHRRGMKEGELEEVEKLLDNILPPGSRVSIHQVMDASDIDKLKAISDKRQITVKDLMAKSSQATKRQYLVRLLSALGFVQAVQMLPSETKVSPQLQRIRDSLAPQEAEAGPKIPIGKFKKLGLPVPGMRGKEKSTQDILKSLEVKGLNLSNFDTTSGYSMYRLQNLVKAKGGKNVSFSNLIDSVKFTSIGGNLSPKQYTEIAKREGRLGDFKKVVEENLLTNKEVAAIFKYFDTQNSRWKTQLFGGHLDDQIEAFTKKYLPAATAVSIGGTLFSTDAEAGVKKEIMKKLAQRKTSGASKHLAGSSLRGREIKTIFKGEGDVRVIRYTDGTEEIVDTDIIKSLSAAKGREQYGVKYEQATPERKKHMVLESLSRRAEVAPSDPEGIKEAEAFFRKYNAIASVLDEKKTSAKMVQYRFLDEDRVFQIPDFYADTLDKAIKDKGLFQIKKTQPKQTKKSQKFKPSPIVWEVSPRKLKPEGID